MAPCFLLLDNIEVMLGITPTNNQTNFYNDNKKNKRTKRRGGHRTSHHAIDRLLSTLLMEIDGIQSNSLYNDDSNENKLENCVIVIATSLCHPFELDRLFQLII